MINKKGLSDVVSNVLIILIVVAAVAILGLIVINLVKSAGGGITSQAACQTLDVQVASCSKSGAAGVYAATASVIRGSGDASLTINKVSLSFVKSDSTTVTQPINLTANSGDGKFTIGETVSGSVTAQTQEITKVIPVVEGSDADGNPLSCALTQKEATCN